LRGFGYCQIPSYLHNMKIFTHYYEAVMYCGEKGVNGYRIKKHQSRPNTILNWYAIDKKGKPVK